MEKRNTSTYKGRWEIRRIQGDGNCIFNALIDQMQNQALPKFKDWDHLALREAIAEHIKGNLPRFTPQIIANINEAEMIEKYEQLEPEARVPQYIEDLKNNGFWGGAEVIIATCNITKARIIIYQEETDELVFTPDNAAYQSTLEILYSKASKNDNYNNHYDSIVQEVRGIEGDKAVPRIEESPKNMNSSVSNKVIYPNTMMIPEGYTVQQEEHNEGVELHIINKARIATWNVRGCCTIEKREAISEALLNESIMIGCIQETHLTTGFYHSDKYDWYLSGGSNSKTSRGVAILVNNSSNIQMNKFIHYSENMALGVIKIMDEVLTIITCHMPGGNIKHSEEEFTKLSQIITVHSSKRERLIIAGDFNAHIGTNLTKTEKGLIGPQLYHTETNANGEELRNLIVLHNMNLCTSWSQSKSTRTTWSNGKTESQIDHILSINTFPKFTMWCRAKQPPMVSTDHKMVFAVMTKRTTQSTTREGKLRKTALQWNVESLKNNEERVEFQRQIKEGIKQLQSDKISTGKTQTNIDEWDNLSSIIRDAAGKTLNKPRSPMTPRRRKALARQQKARFRKANLKQTGIIDAELKEANTLRKDTINQHEMEKCKKFFQSIYTWHPMQRMRMTFKYIKKFKRATKTKRTYIPMSKWEEVIRNGCDEPMVELINEMDHSILSPPPTAEKVYEMIQEFKKGTAPGADRINIELIQEGPAELKNELAAIIKKAWIDNTIPDSWLCSIQVPIPKVPTPKEVGDFRRISLCSIAYKIYAKWLLETLDKTTQPIPQYQAAFLNNRSTDDHIFTLRRITDEAWREGKILYILTLDLAKAFDSVNHKTLITILKNYGVPHYLINRIIKACIHERTSIQWFGQYTQYRNKTTGVKQGCPISPRLFTIVLNEVLQTTVEVLPQFNLDLNSRLTIPTILAYADDLIVIADKLDDLEELIKEISPNLQSTGMKLNLNKCEIMIRDPTTKAGDSTLKDGTITLNNVKIKAVQTMRYLGSHITDRIDRKGTIRPRIVKAIKSARAMTPFIQKHKLPWAIIRTMYNTLITPIALYGLKTSALTKVNRNSLRKMEKLISLWAQFARKLPCTKISELLRGKTIIKRIRCMRLKYWGHINRRPTNNILQTAMGLGSTRRKIGRPCFTWNDSLKSDIVKTKISEDKLQIASTNKAEWEKLMEELYKEPDSAEEEEITVPSL